MNKRLRNQKVSVLSLLMACVGCVSVHADTQPTPELRDQTALYEKAEAGAIEVLVGGRLAGSGWVANAEGYAFTAAHVVNNAKQIDVMGSFGRAVAQVVALDRGHDLALLRLPKRDKAYAHLPTAKITPPVGREIYLYGAPMFRHAVLFPGRVARKSTTFEYLGQREGYIETMHVIAPSPHTTSGGPWFNAAGEIVGLQSGMMQLNGSAVGIAFVTPRDAIATLLATKKSAATPAVRGAFEEIWEQSTEFIAKFPKRTEGLVIRVINKGGPLDQAKLKVEDVILAADGKPVRHRDQMLRLIRSKRPGDTIEVRYLRAGILGSNTVEIKLTTFESN